MRIIPAVREPTGTCVDESGCDAEKTIACAFDQCGTSFDGATNACAVAFLKCADETTWTDAKSLSTACSATAGVSPLKVNACFSGSKGQSLLEDASKLFNAQYPGSTTIPAVAIDDTAVSGVTYDSVVQAACAAGSKADVCNSGNAKSCVV